MRIGSLPAAWPLGGIKSSAVLWCYRIQVLICEMGVLRFGHVDTEINYVGSFALSLLYFRSFGNGSLSCGRWPNASADA